MRLLRTIWLVLCLRCEEAERLRANRASGELSAGEDVAERVHRCLCRNCRTAARTLEAVDRRLKEGLDTLSDVVSAEWSDERRARLERALQNTPHPPRSDGDGAEKT